ncbi:hypothetical protein HK102_010045 [Quaeritorhiza haematococci]|nr:hypothetical protein HK102_010045 [Quaeritorhiza haematococci]
MFWCAPQVESVTNPTFKSLLWHSRHPMRLHLIVDDEGEKTLKRSDLVKATPAWVKLDINHISSFRSFLKKTEKIRPGSPFTVRDDGNGGARGNGIGSISGGRAGTHNQCAWLKPYLHEIFYDVEKLVLVDPPVVFQADVKTLWPLFDQFGDSRAIAVGMDPLRTKFTARGISIWDLSALRMIDWTERLETLTRVWEGKLNGTRANPEEFFEMLFLEDPARFMQLPCAWNADVRNEYRPVTTYSCANAPKAYVVSDAIDAGSPEKKSFLRAILAGYANMDIRGIKTGQLLNVDDGSRLTTFEDSLEALMSADMLRCRGPREMQRLRGDISEEPSVLMASAVLSEDDVHFVSDFVSAVQKNFCNQGQVDRKFVIFWRNDLRLPNIGQNIQLLPFPVDYAKGPALLQLLKFLIVTGKLLQMEGSFDNIIWMDMRSIIVKPVCYELLGESVAVKHSLYVDTESQIWPYESDERSAAYLSQEHRTSHPAYAPTFYSGCGPNFAQFARHLYTIMSRDEDGGKPGVRFESYFQHFLVSNPPFRTLSSAYHFAISNPYQTPAFFPMARIEAHIVYSEEFTTLKNFNLQSVTASHRDEMEQFPTVHVVWAAEAKYSFAIAGCMRSIIANTRVPLDKLRFHVVTSSMEEKRFIEKQFKSIFEKTPTWYQVAVFDQFPKFEWIFDTREDLYTPLNYARFYLDRLFPDVDKFVYLDYDTVVQGDIFELYNTDLTGHGLAAVESCQFELRLYRDLNFNLDTIRRSYDPSACTFIAGVLIIDVAYWRRHNIQYQLEQWMQKNADIWPDYVYMRGSQSPLVLVFLNKYKKLDRRQEKAPMPPPISKIERTWKRKLELKPLVKNGVFIFQEPRGFVGVDVIMCHLRSLGLAMIDVSIRPKSQYSQHYHLHDPEWAEKAINTMTAMRKRKPYAAYIEDPLVIDMQKNWYFSDEIVPILIFRNIVPADDDRILPDHSEMPPNVRVCSHLEVPH